jgi:hypothetical protein
MKTILFLSALLLSNLVCAQSIPSNSPEEYNQEVFGGIAPASEREEILNVIDSFMMAVNTKDAHLFNEILFDGIQKIVTNIQEDGNSTHTVIDNDASLARRLNPSQGEIYHERYWDAQVTTDGYIASVWAPYDFYLNGNFSHCGVDLFYMVKEQSTWKIAHFGYTRNKNCSSK